MKKSIILIICLMFSITIFPEVKVLLKDKIIIKDKDVLLSDINSATQDKAGNIYILDRKACKIFKFNKKGRYLFSFGQKGKGPGDLWLPYNLSVSEKDELVVNSIMGGVSYFSKEGKNIDYPKLEGSLQNIRRVNKNIYLCETSFGEMERKQMVINKEGKILLDKINTMKIMGISINGSFISWGEKEYLPALYADCKNNKAVLSASNDYKITLINGKGEIIRVIKRDIERTPISSKEKSWLKEEILETKFTELHKLLISKIPDYKNFIGGLHLTSNHIWVLRYDGDMRNKNKPVTFDIFSLKGIFLGSIKLKAEPVFIDDEVILLKDKEEDDNPFLIKYSYSLD